MSMPQAAATENREGELRLLVARVAVRAAEEPVPSEAVLGEAAPRSQGVVRWL